MAIKPCFGFACRKAKFKWSPNICFIYFHAGMCVGARTNASLKRYIYPSLFFKLFLCRNPLLKLVIVQHEK